MREVVRAPSFSLRKMQNLVPYPDTKHSHSREEEFGSSREIS